MPREQEAKVGRFFDGYAEDFDSIYGHSRPRSAFERFVDRRFRSSMFMRFQEVLRRTANPAIKSVVDVGCGSGRYIVELLKQGKEVVGLDIAPHMLEVARGKIRDAGFDPAKTELVHASYLDYAPGRTFDAAVLMGFFDYIADPAPTLRKLQQDVDQEIYASFPKAGGPLAWQRALRYRLRKCPLYLYKRADLDALFREVGWTDRVEVIEWGREFFVCARPGARP